MAPRSLTSYIKRISSVAMDHTLERDLVRDIIGDMMRNYSLKEILDQSINMCLCENIHNSQARRLFKMLNRHCDEKHKKAIRHARNVAFGIDEVREPKRHSNRKVIRMIYELENMDLCASSYIDEKDKLEAQGLFDVNLNVNHKVDDRITNIVQKTSDSISGFFGGSNVASFKNKLIRFILVVFECISSSSIASKMRILTSFLIDFEWTTCTLQEYANVLAQVLKRPFRKNEEKEEELEAQFSFDTDFAKKCIQGTMVVMASMLAITPMKGDIPIKLSSAAKLTAVSKSIKTIEGIWKFIDTMFGESLSALLEKMGLSAPEDVLEFMNNEIVTWMQKIDELPELDVLDIAIHSDYDLAQRVIILKREGDRLFVELQKIRPAPATSIMTLFQNKYTYIRNYAKQAAPHFFNDKMRDAPLVVHLYGNSGIGKSTVQNFIVKELMIKMKIDYDPSRDIYVRNDNQDHWDGYHNQPVVFFDDFLQSRNPELRVAQLNELIRINNTTAYPLKMASLEDKGNTRFTSKLVVISSNINFADNDRILRECLECPTAIRRRIHVSARVTIKKEFATSDGRLDKQTLKKDDDGKVKRFDENIYGFVVKGARRPMNYARFVEHCFEQWSEHNGDDQAMIKILPGWTKSEQVPSELDEDDLDMSELEAQFYTKGNDAIYYSAILFRKKEDKYHYRCLLADEHGIWFKTLHRKAFNDASYLDLREEIQVYRHGDGFILVDKKTHQSIPSLSLWVKDHYESIGDANDLEAQFGPFSRTVVESDKISEEELFLINYAIENEDEKPQEDWKQSMKNRFYELKKQVKQKSSDVYDKVKELALKQYEKFNELHPWYKIGLGIVSVLGFVGTLMTAYHFSQNDECVSESSVSGDQRTIQSSRKYMTVRKAESTVSGDQKTVVSSRRYMTAHKMGGVKARSAESAVSGDQKTVMAHRRYELLKSEAAYDRELYDCKYFKEDKSFEAQQSSDPSAYSLIGGMIYNNLAKVSCKGSTINGLFICDSILMLPRHMMLLINDGDVFRVETRKHQYDICIDECDYVEDDQMDVAFIRCPIKKTGGFVSLVKHFHSLDQLSKVNIDTGVLCGVRDVKDGNTMMLMMASNLKPMGRVEYPARIGEEVLEKCILLKGFEYKSQTARGDCGAPLIGLHTGLTKKILGIHTAGSINRGVSNVLTQDYIEEMIGHFNEVIKPEMQLLNCDQILEAHSAVLEDDKVEVFGQVDKCLQFRNSGKTTIRESPLHGIFEVKTAPSMLTKTGDINPLRLALQPQFVDQIVFPQDVVDMAVADLKKVFISYETAYTGKGLLSDHAVLNGIVADKWIRPMNMKTSPGFPYINIKRCKKGKFDFLLGEVGNYVLDEFTSDMVRIREKQAAIGEIPMTLFCDALKDEKRTLDKVQEGKTRVFNTAPFDLSYLVRKYFGNFIAHVMDNHIDGECSVGVDPHSDQWTFMYNNLDVFGQNWIAGDFSKYDKTLSFQLVMGALEVINAWYNDEFGFIRKTLFHTMFNACHLTGSTVYRVHQGNPSGIPLTVIINSLVNSLISRITYTLISRDGGYRSDMDSFNKFVKVKNYGDDNIGKVSSRCHWYHMISIKNCLAAHGMKYTPPTKGDVVCRYLPPEEVTYLKRGFVKRGARVWAPLDMTSIREMLMWYREGPDSAEEAVALNFSVAMREMVHYGEKQFNEFQTYVTEVAARRGLYLPSFGFLDLEKEMTEGYACDLEQVETDYILA